MNNLNQNRSSILCFRRWTRKSYAVFSSLHKVVKIGVISFTCTFVQQSLAPVDAQMSVRTGLTDSVDLSEIEVSGDLPLALPQSTRSMQVVQQREIQSSPVQGIGDILENLAGLDIRQRGSEVQSDVSIRGGSFDQVLILLNGNNLTDPQTGHFNLDLPVGLENIQRIEILQGSAARIWGANAFSGVINIVTGTPTRKMGHSLNMQLASGSFKQMQAGGTYRYEAPDWLTSLSTTYKKSDGYRANTDYETLNSHLQLSKYNNRVGKLELQVGYQQKAFGANSFYTFDYPNQYEKTKTLFGSLNWQKRYGNSLISLKLNERIHHDRFELFRNGENAAVWYTGHNYHLNSVTNGSLNLIQQSHWGKTFVGVDVRNEHILSNVLGNLLPTPQPDRVDDMGVFTKQKNRFNSRLYADHTLYWSDLTLSAGASFNQNSDFGYYLTGGVDAGYNIDKNWKIKANWNRAVRLPTFNDLYYKSANQQSNPNLKPEKSATYEVNLQYSKNRIKLYGSGFFRKGTNVIDWVKHPDSTKWVSKNETSIDAFGADFGWEYRPEHSPITSLSITYSTLTMNKLATGYDSKYALDYLKQKTNLRLEHRLLKTKKAGEFSAVWNLNYQDRAGNYTHFSTTRLTDYKPSTLCDVRLNWKKSFWGVYMDAKNLFDTQYADFGGLTQPGKSLLVGLRLAL